MESRRALAADRHRASGVRWAVCGAAAFLASAVAVDWLSGGLTPLRAGLWVLLAGLVLGALLPERVSAGEGWLEVRGPVRRRRVATGELVSVRQVGRVAVRLMLRDARGGRLELDPRVLAANPLLWHRLETDASRALRCGILREGADLLRELDERISGDRARAVFTRSEL